MNIKSKDGRGIMSSVPPNGSIRWFRKGRFAHVLQRVDEPI